MLRLIKGQGKNRYKRLFDICWNLSDHLYSHYKVSAEIIRGNYIPHELPLAARDKLRTLYELRDLYEEGRPVRPTLKALQGGVTQTESDGIAQLRRNIKKWDRRQYKTSQEQINEAITGGDYCDY